MSICRKFTRYSSEGLAGVAASGINNGLPGGSYSCKDESLADIVSRGKTGMKVPHVAMDTGTAGFRNNPRQKQSWQGKLHPLGHALLGDNKLKTREK